LRYALLVREEFNLGEFSITHWLIILVILLLFFGPSKLPGLGASLGKAIRGFKAGLNEIDPNQDQNAAKNQSPSAHPDRIAGDSAGSSHALNSSGTEQPSSGKQSQSAGQNVASTVSGSGRDPNNQG
jgi:TatA/E family protein of Tat protein translocase